MIEPRDFCFNEETAADNEFMHKETGMDLATLRKTVMKEFEDSVNLLREKSINVITFDKTKHKDLERDFTPDAVFPNNWISTENDGTILIHPMVIVNIISAF
jgi:hypothetical protein